MVENSGRCNKNEDDEKVVLASWNSFILLFFLSGLFGFIIFFEFILMSCKLLQILPDGTAWIPNLVKTMTDVALNGSKAILVDKKLIEGPNPNRRWKEFIPLIFAFQVGLANTLLICFLFLTVHQCLDFGCNSSSCLCT